MMAVMEGAEDPGTEGFVQDIQRLAKYFYADDGFLASTRATRLQRVFNVLTELFDRVGLRTNVGKTVSMACQPCCAIGGHSSEAYGLRMTGWGLTHQ